MTSVAVGAALFASSKDIPSFLQVRDKQKIQLTLQYPNSTVETEEEVGIKIDRNETEGEIPAKIFVEISRRDKGWSSGKVEMKTDTELIPVLLLNARSNGFEIRIFDEKGNPFSCEPLAFSIFQGFKEPPATLPMDLVIEVFITESNKRLLSGLPGLEKNKSLPARGKGTYKTQKEIRPGIADDVLKIPIYEGIPNTRAVHNELAGIVLITGDELPLFLPGGSDVEITLDVDKSRRIMVKTFFPDIDETIKRVIERTTQSEYDADEMDDEIEKALALLAKVEDESTDVNFIGKVKRLRTELEELKEILGNGRSDYNTKTKVMERLRLALIELDDLEIEAEFPRAVEILNTALHELWITDRRYGNIQTTKEVRLLEEQAVKFTREKNLKGIKDLTSQVSSLDFAILFEKEETAIYMSFFKNYDDNFETYTWKNRVKARKFISDAKVIISVNPTKVKLRPIIAELLQLLPETERPKSDNDETFLTEFYNKQ
jgi:molecular chaperone DnaK